MTSTPLQSRTRFKSILSRIVFLHVIALGIISVLMPLALHWLLAREADRLHLTAMRDLADTVASFLAVDATGQLTLDAARGSSGALLAAVRPLRLWRRRRDRKGPVFLTQGTRADLHPDRTLARSGVLAGKAWRPGAIGRERAQANR